MISGDMDAALLPRPVFKAADIQIGDIDGGDGVIVEELDARLAFVPLLSGRMQIRELSLLRPVARLIDTSSSFLSSLEYNWHDQPRSGEGGDVGGASTFDLAVDSIEIEDGTIEVLGPLAAKRWQATGINSTATLTPRGGVAIESSLSVQGTPLRVEATWTPINSGRAYGVNIAIDLIEADIQAKFIGSENRSTGGGFRGDVSVVGER